MTLSPWRSIRDPWVELNRLREEMNRVVSRRESNDRVDAPVYPAMNLWQDGESLFVESELPGIKLDDLEIVVTSGNQLSIKGRRRPALGDDSVWHRQERSYGEFSRMVQLPIEVDADRVQAVLKNGVLRLKLPKHAETKPRKITVKGA